MRWLAPALVVMSLGCAGVQRVPLQSDSVRLPDGRFNGPFEIRVPRRADHQGHDFEIHVTLRTRCAPKLVLAFPDGETESLGANDARWQDLLALRASGERVQPQAPPMAPRPTPPPAAPVTPPVPQDGPLPFPGQPASASVTVDAALVVPMPQRPAGHWETVTTETWTGQLAFERERERRCAQETEYRATYLNAFDETGTIALWSEVPQELLGASLSYEIIELVPPKVDAPPKPAPAVVEVTTPRPPKERPPQPSPRTEHPAAPVEPRATWIPGQWTWSEGKGAWVWHGGSWRAPAAPALQVEATGAPPNAGCTWAPGYWTWEGTEGRWVWQRGYWKAPPPLDEPRGEPPGPGAPWQAGHWTWVNVRFVWTPGRWGKPTAYAETPPAPPFSGAQWVRGDWILVGGRWVWSPGFYEGAQRPPPPRAETPGVAPGPGAIWLHGYWRWELARGEFSWIDGHWELPPGEGYVWVPEPQGTGGLVLRGHWELQVRVAP
ncbi:MAG: hypothetical protein Q8L48_43895 [Archangium sp.]|nr:hypothetical protein [Archangium sp.]